ncbi:hypothetical protein H2200_001182 [Cladophialophora chaetospira]|uniref:Uncharacterized protein n=1 Tax=Cladophialophora chaetospira TaxID=386627 RepID=A0AA38XKI4_9EURO|nr:hypothetical protein H2200_001182 [Cladophialophora chaetospira]
MSGVNAAGRVPLANAPTLRKRKKVDYSYSEYLEAISLADEPVPNSLPNDDVYESEPVVDADSDDEDSVDERPRKRLRRETALTASNKARPSTSLSRRSTHTPSTKASRKPASAPRKPASASRKPASASRKPASASRKPASALDSDTRSKPSSSTSSSTADSTAESLADPTADPDQQIVALVEDGVTIPEDFESAPTKKRKPQKPVDPKIFPKTEAQPIPWSEKRKDRYRQTFRGRVEAVLTSIIELAAETQPQQPNWHPIGWDIRMWGFARLLKLDSALEVVLAGIVDEAQIVLGRTKVCPADMLKHLPRVERRLHNEERGDYMILGDHPTLGWAFYPGATGNLYSRVFQQHRVEIQRAADLQDADRQDAARQDAARQDTDDQAAGDQAADGQDVGDQAADGQDVDGQDVDGQDVDGQDVDGQDVDGQDVDGQGLIETLLEANDSNLGITDASVLEVQAKKKLAKFYHFLAQEGWQVSFLVLGRFGDDIHWLYSFLTETILIILLNSVTNEVFEFGCARHTEAMKKLVDKALKLEFVDEDGNELLPVAPTYAKNSPPAATSAASDTLSSTTAIYQLNRCLPLEQVPAGGNRQDVVCRICKTEKNVSFFTRQTREDCPVGPAFSLESYLCKNCYSMPDRNETHEEYLNVLHIAETLPKECWFCEDAAKDFPKRQYYTCKDPDGNPAWICSLCRLKELRGTALVKCADCKTTRGKIRHRPFFGEILCPQCNLDRVSAHGCSNCGKHKSVGDKWYCNEIVRCKKCYLDAVHSGHKFSGTHTSFPVHVDRKLPLREMLKAGTY